MNHCASNLLHEFGHNSKNPAAKAGFRRERQLSVFESAFGGERKQL